MDIFELDKKNLVELRKIAAKLNFPKPIRMKREGLIIKIAQTLAEAEGIEMRGVCLPVTVASL